MSIGEPLPRIDGPIKVTGAARYTADLRAPDMLYGVVVTASIPAGRVAAIEKGDALAESGVVRVLTHEDMPRARNAIAGPPFAHSFLPLQSDEIRHEGQPIALVLAETLEAAEAGAGKMKVRYDEGPIRAGNGEGSSGFGVAGDQPSRAGAQELWILHFRARILQGKRDAESCSRSKPDRVVYWQPSRHHNPMEPSAVLAQWEGDALTVYDSTQHVFAVQQGLAALFGIPVASVRVISQHTGGAFGVKGLIWPHEALAALASRITARPVRIALSRANMYSFLGYQPRIVRKMGLSADKKGALAAITHDVVNTALR